MRSLHLFLAAPCVATWALSAAPARAQVNSDYGIQAGVAERITTGSDTAVNNPTPGPMVEIQGHLAVLPMLRVGLYASWDMSPISGYGTRNFYEGGLRAKFIPPILAHPWKMYFFLGAGLAYAHQQSFVNAGSPTPAGATPQETYGSIDGFLIELPLGMGLAYKVRRGTELFAELGGRLGVGFFGNIYDQDNTATGYEPQVSPSTIYGPFQGQDSFALSFSVGVSFGD